MSAQQLTLDECLTLAELEDDLKLFAKDLVAKYAADGILVFENVDLASRWIGKKFVIPYGPNSTLREIPADGKCHITPPDGCGYAWQYYLCAYSVKEGR